MEKYEALEIEIIRFNDEDVIATSQTGPNIGYRYYDEEESE